MALPKLLQWSGCPEIGGDDFGGYGEATDKLRHGRRAQSGDDNQVLAADAGDFFAVAAEDLALGAGVEWHLSRESAVELSGG
jgi:hypothetical protein